MALTKEFIEAVENSKKIRVRIMLKDIMLVDPTMKNFDEMIAYAETKMPELYDEHDGEELLYDSSEWKESYLNNQMVVVVNNFSKERLELLRNIVKYLYRDRIQKMQEQQEEPQSGISKKQVGVGMTAAGTVAAVAGICTSNGILIAGGAAVAVAGVILIVSDKE